MAEIDKFELWAENQGINLEPAHVRGVTYRFDEAECAWLAWQHRSNQLSAMTAERDEALKSQITSLTAERDVLRIALEMLDMWTANPREDTIGYAIELAQAEYNKAHPEKESQSSFPPGITPADPKW